MSLVSNFERSVANSWFADSKLFFVHEHRLLREEKSAE